MRDFVINDGEIGRILHKQGIKTWLESMNYIGNLPYGRNANREDFLLVLKEQKGTCSSKHSLIKLLSVENDYDVRLILSIYKMTGVNTIGIGNVLSNYDLAYIPEAHCYLQVEGTKYDFTSSDSDFGRIKNDILVEKEIALEQVSSYKVQYHKEYLKKWIAKNNIQYNFESIWQIREKCISALS